MHVLLSARGPLWSLRREGSHGTNLVGIAVPRPSDWRYRQALLLISTAFASSTVPVGQLAFGAALEAGIDCAALLFAASLASLAVCAFVRWNVRRR